MPLGSVRRHETFKEQGLWSRIDPIIGIRNTDETFGHS